MTLTPMAIWARRSSAISAARSRSRSRQAAASGPPGPARAKHLRLLGSSGVGSAVGAEINVKTSAGSGRKWSDRISWADSKTMMGPT